MPIAINALCSCTPPFVRVLIRSMPSQQPEEIPNGSGAPGTRSESGFIQKTETSGQEIGVSGTFKTGAGQLDLRATGLYAGVVLCSGVALYVMTDVDLHKLSTWPSLLVLVSFVGGMLVHAIAWHGRLADALREKDHYRLEVKRISEAKSRLEETILDHRLSSDGAKSKGKPTERKAQG